MSFGVVIGGGLAKLVRMLVEWMNNKRNGIAAIVEHCLAGFFACSSWIERGREESVIFCSHRCSRSE
jgi:hypothetical protein